MKQLIFLLIILIPGFNYAGDLERVNVWTVCKESKISILGSSNINTFSFDIKEYSGKDTLVAAQKPNQTLAVFRKGLVHLPVNDFKNSNPFLTRDFKKIVKAKSYPDILLNFRSLNSLPAIGAKDERIAANIEISLAGQNKTFQVYLLASRLGNTVYLKGNEKLYFSDFGLTAPQNVMGFVDVNDELNVSFQLTLKSLK